MRVGIKVDITEIVALGKRAERQVPFAISRALNMTVDYESDWLRNDLRTSIDQPTNYSIDMVYPRPNVKRQGPDRPYSSKKDLTAQFGITEYRYISKNGANSPSDVLNHLFTGGPAQSTRYEKAFRRIGMLGINEEIVPAKNLPELNIHGNIPASLINQLLAYFQAFSEVGFRANMSDKGRAKLANRTGPKMRGKKKSPYVKINGVVYFYARGDDHLHRGIWAKTGTHGIKLRPIMLFVRRPIYRKMINMRRYAQDVPREFSQNFTLAFQRAMATAR